MKQVGESESLGGEGCCSFKRMKAGEGPLRRGLAPALKGVREGTGVWDPGGTAHGL